MKIIGPDTLVFGVDDIKACEDFLLDYGLQAAGNGRFEALDGTGIVIALRNDPCLPAPLATGSMLRETIYGTADAATLESIAQELSRDREVCRLADGSIRTHDDSGFAIGFQTTIRRSLALPTENVNAPGAAPCRPVNVVGVDEQAMVRPRTLSHVVYFIPDYKIGEAFYVDRLGFRCTDRFVNVGPFLRPGGTDDHHALFLIEATAFMQGCEHLAFHLGGPTEVMLAGTRLTTKGYQPFWGPGRHKLGSN